jgi:hypothetical protein
VVPGTLEEAIRELIAEAKEDGGTIYTLEAVKRLRADHPEPSSAAITDAVIRAAAAHGVPVRMEVPLEIR